MKTFHMCVKLAMVHADKIKRQEATERFLDCRIAHKKAHSHA
jgi:hypothetical protein